MILVSLDYSVSEEELADIQLAVGDPVEVHRIPFLLPLRWIASPTPWKPDALLPHLRRLDLARFRGQRVLMVAPEDARWYASLAEAIRVETGQYPLLVQPEARRAEVGCPGPLRILDLEAYLLDEDALGTPPWLVDGDGLIPPDVLDFDD